MSVSLVKKDEITLLFSLHSGFFLKQLFCFQLKHWTGLIIYQNSLSYGFHLCSARCHRFQTTKWGLVSFYTVEEWSINLRKQGHWLTRTPVDVTCSCCSPVNSAEGNRPIISTVYGRISTHPLVVNAQSTHTHSLDQLSQHLNCIGFATPKKKKKKKKKITHNK